jgi:predicted Zn-dependent peptidase
MAKHPTRQRGIAPRQLRLRHERFRLENGLNVILHRHAATPRVVVNLLYRVGSGDDPAGRHGLAHLLEHLMFMGTRRLPHNRFDLLMEEAGGWNNAYTGEDHTVYYDLGPARLLETLLWAEADRMAGLVEALDQRKLDLQREVVLNELWQEYENAPYGAVELAMPSLLYPSRHPYSWPVIGRERHLRAVTTRDIERHFSRYYCPANAVLAIAGDIDPQRTRALVQRYFGWISTTGPGPGRRSPPAVKLTARVVRQFEDQVELPKLILAWHSPSHFQPGDAELDLAAEVLASGKRSRLYQDLVYERRLALKVEAYQLSRRMGSLFVVEVTGRADSDPARLERAVRSVLRDFVTAPPSARELARARNGFETRFVAGLQQLRRRAELLSLYFATTGDPDYAAEDLLRYRRAKPRSVQRWAREVLRPRRVGLFWVLPGSAIASMGGSR